ncbi:putative bifunctional diguanylate cyclase/phosphodiesterase [Aureimonas glaciei]|nr:sensor domain-containing phosphodiesterase [Aureimonas glaciei]
MTDVAEGARLMSLQQLRLLGTPASESFDRITRTACLVFGLPYAAISLTDQDRQWFKSRVGIDPAWMARSEAPCSQVAEKTMSAVIADLAADDGFRDGELVRSGIRFYAGAPLVTRDGQGIGALCVLGPDPREATDAEMAALHDLAAMVMTQVELEHAFGRIDPISGLPNRAQFVADLLDLARSDPGGTRLAVLVDLADTAQLDNFARVMGYSHVDGMVKYAADLMRERLGPERAAYHVSATQFAFLAPVGTELDAYAQSVAAGLIESRALSQFRFIATTVIGLAPFRLGVCKTEDLLRGLHSAAKEARTGGAPVRIYSPAIDEMHRRRFQLLQDFDAAIADPSQLRLVFQPRVDLASRACIGAEALLRWTHPTLGNIGPAEFIPIVEHSTHARAMTAFVVDAAARQLASWRKAGIGVNLSLNISAANLQERDFAERMGQILSRHDVVPQELELEMTESAIMKDTGLALQQLNALAQLGVRLAIDDFGTGYSSLAYLQRLPMHVVKIDQSFIRGIAADSRERKLVGSMIALSRDLGLRVVAEGVETAETATILSDLACEEAQGYFFARPMEATAFAPWLALQAA